MWQSTQRKTDNATGQAIPPLRNKSVHLLGVDVSVLFTVGRLLWCGGRGRGYKDAEFVVLVRLNRMLDVYQNTDIRDQMKPIFAGRRLL